MSSDYDHFEQDHAGSGSSFRLKTLVPEILSRWYWLLLGVLLGLSFGFYQAWKTIPMYRSQATVLVRDYSVSVLQTIDAAEFDLRSNAALETIRSGLMKYELCERVASDPKIRALDGLVPPKPKKLFAGDEEDEVSTAGPPPSPQLAGMIRSWLTVDLIEESRIMSVRIQHPTPKVAAAIANAIVDEYIKQRAEIRESGKAESFELLSAQADRLTTELSRSKTQLAIYETPNRAELGLVSAEQEFNLVTLRYRKKHPKYIEAHRKVEQAKEQLRRSLERVVVNPTDQDYWQNHGGLLKKNDGRMDLDTLREKLIERRAQLETEIESQTNISETLLTQVETTEINKSQNEAEVIPYEKARASRVPITEGKTSQLIEASILGLAGGIAIALLFHFLDNKYHTVDDLEASQSVPVLAAIPHLGEKVIKKLKGGIVPSRSSWTPTLVFRQEDTQTIIAESFRVLRASVSLLGPADERKITLVTSAFPSEGKTTVASNLACAMAEEGRRVVLVDLDLRKPSLHRGFGKQKDGTFGIVDILSANTAIENALITDTGLDNLDLLLSGRKAPNPGELLNSLRLKNLLDQLAQMYDHVVVDSAPVLAVADSRLIAPLVDNFIFVVRADQTPKPTVSKALEILASDNSTPSGLVLNDFQEKRLRAGKNYGYYRSGQYSYGSYGSED